jgi:hypothetical protein
VKNSLSHIKRVASRTCIIFFLFLLTSCASIVSKSSYPVFIDSNPTESRLTVTDKKGQIVYQGKTPKTLKLNASAGYFSRAAYIIKIEHEDFETSTTTIEAKIDGWYFGNIVFGGFIGFLLVDPLTGAMYKIDDHTIYEKLYFEGYQGLYISPFEEMPEDIKSALVELSPNQQ